MIVGIYKIECPDIRIPQLLTRVIKANGGKALVVGTAVITNYVFTKEYPKGVGDKVHTRSCNAWDYGYWREEFGSS